MAWLQQHLTRRSRQYNLASIHHHNMVADARNGPQIMADIQHRHVSLMRQVPKQLENMRLCCDIKPGRRLIK